MYVLKFEAALTSLHTIPTVGYCRCCCGHIEASPEHHPGSNQVTRSHGFHIPSFERQLHRILDSRPVHESKSPHIFFGYETSE
jgi:hypothetical protein